LKAQLAGFEKEFVGLRQQVIQVEELKAEISELRERLGPELAQLFQAAFFRSSVSGEAAKESA
jgi:hypothetical protein